MTPKSPQTQADELAERVAKIIYQERLDHVYGECPNTVEDVKQIILKELNLTELLADKQRLDWLEENLDKIIIRLEQTNKH